MKYVLKNRVFIIVILTFFNQSSRSMDSFLNPLVSDVSSFYSYSLIDNRRRKEEEAKEFFSCLWCLPHDIQHHIADLLLGNSLIFNFELSMVLKGHTGKILSVACSADEKIAVTGSDDGTARLWDVTSGKELKVFSHTGRVCSVACGPGKMVLIGSSDGIARLWNTDSESILELKGHTGGIVSVACSPDGETVVTGSGDGLVRLWEASSGNELKMFACEGKISSVVFSSDSNTVLIGGSDYRTYVWDIKLSGKLQRLFHTSDWSLILFIEYLQGTGAICLAVFSPTMKEVLTCRDDGIVCLWDLDSGKELQWIEATTEIRWGYARIYAGVFSPDREVVLMGVGIHPLLYHRVSGEAFLWDSKSGNVFLKLKGHIDFVSSVAFSPKGNMVITGSYDTTARIWKMLPCEASDCVLARIMPLGAWFIARAFEGKKTGSLLSIGEKSFEHEIYTMFPENVREYIQKWYL